MNTKTAYEQTSLDLVMMFFSKRYNDRTAVNYTYHYCLQAKTERIQKQSMEFFATHGFTEDLQRIVKQHLNAPQQTMRNWARVYQLFLDKQLRIISHTKLLEKVENVSIDEPELICLLSFIKMSIYFEQRRFERIGDFLMQKKHLFAMIKDRFFLLSFQLRLKQFLFTYYWVRNELIMARKIGFQILNLTIDPSTKAKVHSYLGITYLFDTYKQGMYHLKKAYFLAKREQLPILSTITQKYIPFFAAHFNKTKKMKTHHRSTQAYLEIARGNNQKALELLLDCSTSDPLILYYLGLAKSDQQLLKRSAQYFIKKENNFFFSRLPLIALNKLQQG